jgi:hypothetical protein
MAGSSLVSGEVSDVPRPEGLSLTAHADVAGYTSGIRVHVPVAFKRQEVAEEEYGKNECCNDAVAA